MASSLSPIIIILLVSSVIVIIECRFYSHTHRLQPRLLAWLGLKPRMRVLWLVEVWHNAFIALFDNESVLHSIGLPLGPYVIKTALAMLESLLAADGFNHLIVAWSEGFLMASPHVQELRIQWLLILLSDLVYSTVSGGFGWHFASCSLIPFAVVSSIVVVNLCTELSRLWRSFIISHGILRAPLLHHNIGSSLRVTVITRRAVSYACWYGLNVYRVLLVVSALNLLELKSLGNFNTVAVINVSVAVGCFRSFPSWTASRNNCLVP